MSIDRKSIRIRYLPNSCSQVVVDADIKFITVVVGWYEKQERYILKGSYDII
jgi:hypothetical protein